MRHSAVSVSRIIILAVAAILLAIYGTACQQFSPSSPSQPVTEESPPVNSTRQTLAIPKSSPTSRDRSINAPTKERSKGLSEVDCGPNCSWDFEPAVSSVEWLEPPAVSRSGLLSLMARVGENDHLTLPNSPGGGASNIALTNGGARLYGMVIPPAPPGMNWDPTPGQWVADAYKYRGRTLTVAVGIDSSAAGQSDLTLCLWTGGRGPGNRVLDCVPVERP